MFFSPSSCCVSFPFNDDLGTPPTWRPHSWKKIPDADTHQALQDPMQEDLWWNTQFCLIVHECFQQVERKEQIQGLEYEDCPKAIRVPANDTGILEAKAFFSTVRLRHVKVDSGFHTVSRQAWRYCHSLRIVKWPDTVVAIGYAAFQGCCSLMTVEMPGCVELGVRLFYHFGWSLPLGHGSRHRTVCL